MIRFIRHGAANAQKMALLFGILSITLIGASRTGLAQSPVFGKQVSFDRAAVVTAHPLATNAALQILQQGGNAFDAAITAQLVLSVVYPEAGNLGGGGFLIGYTRQQKKICIDYREKAPGHSTENMYLDSNGQVIPGLSVEGSRACGVPGTIDGLRLTHRYARLPLSILIQPAIDLAEQGFVLSPRQANTLNNYRSFFIRNNSAPIAFVKNDPWKAGDTLIQKTLAETLRRIQQHGWSEFYIGRTADLIVDHMQKTGGFITHHDLKDYEAIHRNVYQFKYNRYTILTAPLPSSGGILLKQMFRMAALAEKKPDRTPSTHIMAEVARRAYEDRALFLGDGDFVHVPVKRITSWDYLRKRMTNYDANQASPSITRPISPLPESEETTHLSIVDDSGNAVSVTTTLNSVYGSKTVVTGAGFLLNNEMDDFSIKPGVPNQFGATGGCANAIQPGKRMLSCMTPTIVLRKNKPCLILGTPGGTTIPTNVFQTIRFILDFNMRPQEAVNKPKFHHQWIPDCIYVESSFPPEEASALTQRGHQVVVREPIGRMELIYLPAGSTQRMEAVADARGDDCAGGY